MPRRTRYNVTDGKIVLTLEEDEKGWYVVRCPMEPALVTQAKTIHDAFRMARDAAAALRKSRSKLTAPAAPVASPTP